MKKIIFTISFFCLSWAALPLSAEVMTYQGRLKESNIPVNTNRTFIFELCDAETGGNCFTTPSSYQSFTVQNGLFKSTFAVPTSDLSQGQWYLQVSVGVIPPLQILSPRERLTAVPYSVFASSSGYSASAVQKNGDTMTGQLTLAGSTLTLTGAAFSVAGSTFAVKDGNVGIGTSAPSYRLDVFSAGSAQSDTAQVWRDNTGVIKSSVSATGVLMAAKFVGDGSGLTGVTGATGTDPNALPLAGGTMTGPLTLAGSTLTVTGGAFSVGGSTFIVDSGRVGIGIAAPAGVLHIVGANPEVYLGATSGNPGFRLGRPDTSAYANIIYSDGDPANVANARWAVGLRNGNSDYQVWDDPAGMTRLVVTNAGSVGIGTASPGALLDVAGSGNFSGGLTALSSGTFRAVGANQFSVETSSGILVQAGRVQTPALRLTNGAAANYVLASDAVGNASWVNPGAGGLGDPFVGNEITDAADASLTRSGTGTLVDPYKIGLNLSNANTWVAAQTFSGGLSGSLTGPASQNVLKAGDTMTGQLTLAGSTLTVTGDAFSVGGSTLVVTNGYIGLGTNAPAARLHVVSDNGYVHFASPNSAFTLNLIPLTYSPAVINNNGAGPLALSIANDPKIYMTPDSLVGVGTSTPLYRLHVSSAAGEGGTVMAVSTGSTNVFWVDGSGANALKFTGDGSGLTGVTGASGTDSTKLPLTGGTLSGQLTLTGSSLTVSGVITAANYRIAGSTILAILPGNASLGIGLDAGRANIMGGDYNSFLGYWAGYSNTTGGYNSFVGASAGFSNTIAGNNSFVGASAGYSNIIGGNNSFLGTSAGFYNDTGGNNSLVGFNAGLYNQTGSGNAILGSEAGYGVAGQSYSNNTLVGYRTGYGLTTGSQNLFLGLQAGYNVTSGGGNIVLGYNKDTSAPGASNELNIGGLLYGDLAAKTIGISTRVPQAALDIVSTATAANVYAQIWRDGAGGVTASVTSQGRFSGDGSGLTNVTSAGAVQKTGDTMSGQLTLSGSSLTVSGAVTASDYRLAGSTSPVLAVLPGGSFGVGLDAGRLNQAGGGSNFFAGTRAGYYNTTGFGNSFLGLGAGYSNVTGADNTFVGFQAGYLNTASFNAFFGHQAGYNNASGSYNSFFGTYAGLVNTTGKFNSLVGYKAGQFNMAGGSNTVMGYNAGSGLPSYSYAGNTLMGYQAGFALSTGSNNTLIGAQAGDSLTTGSGNIVVGFAQTIPSPADSGKLNIGGVLFGDLSAKTIGISTRVPQAALDIVSTGTAANIYAQIWRDGAGVVTASVTSQGKFSGNGSALTGITASDPSKLPLTGGTLSGQLTLAGSSLTVSGNIALSTVIASGDITARRYQINGSTVLAILPGTDSLGIGLSAGRVNIGNNNSFLGNSAGYANTTGSNNSFLGAYAGWNNTTGMDNAFIGYNAGYINTTGSNNSFLGVAAASNNTTGGENSVVGHFAGYFNVIGSGNTILGAKSGRGVSGQSYSSNTLVGYKTGYGLSTGSDNLFLGWQAGYNVTTGSGNIVLGYGMDTSAPTASNELNIGGVLYGNLASGSVGIGAGVTSPAGALQVGQNGIIISTGGAIQTTGMGNSLTVGSARGNGAVDLQTSRAAVGQVASGAYSVVSGGSSNLASGVHSAVSGGNLNNAWGNYSIIAGGENNSASGAGSIVAGGNFNSANTTLSAVVGGSYNTADGMASFIGGGGNNQAKGWGAVAFGANNASMSDYSFAAGYKSTSAANGTFTWADSTSEGAVNNILDQVMFKAKGGFWVSTGTVYTDPGLYVDSNNRVGIGTIVPAFKLHVKSDTGGTIAGLSSSASPTDAAVYGWADSGATAVKGVASAGYAGRFEGNVYVTDSGVNPASPAKLQVNGDLGLGDGTATGNTPVVVWLQNNSGALVSSGSIVAASGLGAFTTTNVANSISAIGIVYEPAGIAVGAVGRVAIAGIVRAIPIGTIAINSCVATSTTNGQAAGVIGPTIVGSCIGVWMEAATNPGMGTVLLR